ncbi:AAA family ATPase, partial [candidate division KSB3 bacterium]|nr:AAA family ATPase [candidate division KSB3 bacterium]MBD3324241.1 AAA family ATPase [candidate division KSB3 bacterium]
MKFLEQLNPKQRQAVTAPLQPILVIAGPGTGKTRTLVARMLYLIQHYGIPPHKILAVTFTNKAKDEMRSRLREELGDAVNDLTIGTFHRYCLDVLRTYHREVGLPKQFAIADETTQLMTLSHASRITDERSLRTVLNAISSYRLNKDHLNPNFQGVALKWLTPYQKKLRKNNLIDFDQIILLTQTLLSEHPELIEEQQQRFDAILVDEFQDTDPVQYDIMRSLAQQHRNVFAVADDDQSIFAWRGAHIENIQRYMDDFECRDNQIILDEN